MPKEVTSGARRRSQKARSSDRDEPQHPFRRQQVTEAPLLSSLLVFPDLVCLGLQPQCRPWPRAASATLVPTTSRPAASCRDLQLGSGWVYSGMFRRFSPSHKPKELLEASPASAATILGQGRPNRQETGHGLSQLSPQVSNGKQRNEQPRRNCKHGNIEKFLENRLRTEGGRKQPHYSIKTNSHQPFRGYQMSSSVYSIGVTSSSQGSPAHTLRSCARSAVDTWLKRQCTMLQQTVFSVGHPHHVTSHICP